MPKLPAFLSLVLPLCVLPAVACTPAQSALPANAQVEIVQTQKVVLHGTAAPHPASASCASGATSPDTRYLQLKDSVTANFTLRPTGGVAVLHLQELATNRTWCVMTHSDGTGATIPGEFPAGIYSVSVEGSHSDAPTSYAVELQTL